MAMSGGIDSTVAAILLLKQEYELIGITFRTFDSISTACMEKEKGCCNVNSLFEAKHVAESLGFEHQLLDLRNEFRDTVINNFINEYLKGRTPNPCVLCNSYIKWGYLFEQADILGCDYIATGHYARIGCDNHRYFLQKGIDATKDQSYFLWTLTQENLARTLFPLGSLTKNEVRLIAHKEGFEKISQKKESQEICFIPDNDYRHFLETHVENYKDTYKEGHFINTEGTSIGKHKGFPNYTIGQRKGLQVAFGTPKYVCAIDPIQNTVMLGDKEDLLATEMTVKNIHFQKYNPIPPDFEATVKIRYRDTGHLARIQQENDTLKVSFLNPVSAITPGQSAVIYEGDDLVAGGVIESC